jgi:isoleucyl-tRNA synthetase
MGRFREVDPKRPVNDAENAVLQYWRDNDIPTKSITEREGSPEWIFYEGPPTANGRPGIHHVLSRMLKDVACRYKTMQGYQVRRKAGWDTHGLPVELEVEKKLGLSSKPEIEEYGIEEFNKQCRESVFNYLKDWRELTERIGYWIDMDRPYMTLFNEYVESVWWILKQYFDAGLIYEGHKVMPYCPRCGTPLASHEVAQGYEEETIDSIYVKIKVKGKDEYMLIWTTTPWTLPSNVGVAVNPESTYVRARRGDEVFIVVKERVVPLLGEDAEILEEFPGKALEYLEYEPVFPFTESVMPPGSKAFFVTLADYVSTEDGTGLVHIAGAYGEDDYKVCQQYGIPLIHMVDEQGKFISAVCDWAGTFVFEANPSIVKKLRSTGQLFKTERLTHSYPHCWRCSTPLVYYARKSWYIATTKYQDRLIEANKKVKWYPEHIGTGRMGNWLENLVDWALSRNRYWGTPLNIWRCEKCGKLECVGSRKELAERAVEKIDAETFDPHRPYVDNIHLKCECGGVMTRTPEVIDCWFDAGSMPYAQWHYPFEHKDDFHKLFPADFICEGLDQTRGWFYTLLAISTFLFDQSSFKSVLVNDLVLDKDGQKMSKSRGNTVDPWDMINRFGVDALRWYLLAVSPPWVPTRFDAEGVKEVASRFFGTLQNVYSFFTLYANIDNLDPKEFDIPVADRPEIDRWIISRLNSLVKQVRTEMESYELTRVVRSISAFVVDEVSNWYVRRTRERFWSNEFDLSKKSAYRTLYEVLLGVAKLIAPFAPFIADDIYLNLTGAGQLVNSATDGAITGAGAGKATGYCQSVHLDMYPEADDSLIDPELEERMGLVITLVSLGRAVRNKVQIKVRQPLREMLVNGKSRGVLARMEDLLKEELNVKEVVYVDSLNDYVSFEVRPNLPVAGPKYGKLLRSIMAALPKADAGTLAREAEAKGQVDLVLEVPADVAEQAVKDFPAAARLVDGKLVLTLSKEDLDVRIQALEGFAVEVEGDQFVILDTEIDRELVLEGIARELISKVQTTRKSLGFNVTDHINMWIASDAEVAEALERHGDYVKGDTLTDSLEIVTADALASVTAEGEAVSPVQELDLNGHPASIRVQRLPR